MSRAIGLSAAALPLTRRPMRLVGGARRCLASAFIPGVPRKLEEIVKLELLAATEPDRLLHVWAGYHADQPELAGAAAEAEEFNLIVKRGTESPRFIWPVRRDGGHFLLFSQCALRPRLRREPHSAHRIRPRHLSGGTLEAGPRGAPARA